MKINKQEMVFVKQKRNEAIKRRDEPVHVFPTGEPHVLEEQICWCEPDVEDFTGEGGGVLFIHKRHVWQ